MRRYWSGQIFPIAVLAVIAALTYWLQASLAPAEVQADRSGLHEPDAIVEDFEIRRLDENGKLQYRLTAPRLRHFPDDDSSEISAPHLIAYRDNREPLSLTAGEARVTERGKQVLLTGDVTISRPAASGRAELVARTDRLSVAPEAGTAQTDQPMTITQGASRISGVGARIDNKTSTFELRSRVRGQYLSARARP